MSSIVAAVNILLAMADRTRSKIVEMAANKQHVEMCIFFLFIQSNKQLDGQKKSAVVMQSGKRPA